MEPQMTTTKSEQATHAFAMQFAKTLSAPAMLLLSGELGAGKTCFTRGLCEGLGGEPRQVSSPTFSIMQEYDIADNQRLVHIDAYRLSGEEELESIGWEELLEDENTIIAIEWASHIRNAIPANAISVHLEHVDQHSREITLQ
jgi:tRNA threonylcarbamoyladenosine biosynthesis protein TsaE